MLKKLLNQNCERCLKGYGNGNNNKNIVRCDQASHAICEGLASPIIPNWRDYIEWENQSCEKCLERHGIENNDNRCDEASHAICEGLASPIIPNWKDHIEWNKIEVKMLE